MSRLTFSLSHVSLAAFSYLMIALPAAQATIIHSNVPAATVNYTGISEGSTTGDPEPLYGQPIAVVDTLVFPTTGSFAATSIDGQGSDQTGGKVSFTVEAHAGYKINAINFSETGPTTLFGPFGGDAFTQVVGSAVVKVIEVNNSPVSLPTVSAFLNMSPLGGQYLLSAIGGTTYITIWNGSLSFPLPAGTTKALVTLDNNLFAATLSTGNSALIGKDLVEIQADTSVIPEPSTVLLGAAGMLVWSLVGTRRQARV